MRYDGCLDCTEVLVLGHVNVTSFLRRALILAIMWATSGIKIPNSFTRPDRDLNPGASVGAGISQIAFSLSLSGEILFLKMM